VGALELVCYIYYIGSQYWGSCRWGANVLSQGPESSPSPCRNIIAAPFVGSDGGEMAGLVARGPGMKDIFAVGTGLGIRDGLDISIASTRNDIYVYRTILVPLISKSG
jgi:hypothetical protein